MVSAPPTHHPHPPRSPPGHRLLLSRPCPPTATSTNPLHQLHLAQAAVRLPKLPSENLNINLNISALRRRPGGSHLMKVGPLKPGPCPHVCGVSVLPRRKRKLTGCFPVGFQVLRRRLWSQPENSPLPWRSDGDTTGEIQEAQQAKTGKGFTQEAGGGRRFWRPFKSLISRISA